MFSFWYRNIKVAENFRGNISFVKTQTRLKLLCLSWICWRCERQSWAESILGNSCWFSADDLKFEFWPVEIDSIYLGGTKLAEEESVSKKVCLERKSKYQHEHQKDPGLQSLCISLFVFWFLPVSFAGSALFWPATTEKSTNKTVLLGTVTHSSRLLVIYWCISKITLLSLFHSAKLIPDEREGGYLWLCWYFCSCPSICKYHQHSNVIVIVIVIVITIVKVIVIVSIVTLNILIVSIVNVSINIILSSLLWQVAWENPWHPECLICMGKLMAWVNPWLVSWENPWHKKVKVLTVVGGTVEKVYE